MTLDAGTLLAGYMKGKWHHLAGDAESSDVRYEPSHSDEYIIYNGQYKSLQSVVEAHIEEKPAAKHEICYCSKTDVPKPGNPGFFELSMRQQIVYRPSDAPAAVKDETPDLRVVSQPHLGPVLVGSQWTSRYLHITWVVRWVAKGLQPVRPAVVLRCPVVVSAGMCVKLSD